MRDKTMSSDPNTARLSNPTNRAGLVASLREMAIADEFGPATYRGTPLRFWASAAADEIERMYEAVRKHADRADALRRVLDEIGEAIKNAEQI